MPTKRKPITRAPVAQSWVERLRAGHEPANAAERDGYLAWRAGSDVPGLPAFKDCREPLLLCPLRGGWGRGW